MPLHLLSVDYEKDYKVKHWSSFGITQFHKKD